MSLLQPNGKRKYVKAQGMDNYTSEDSFFTEITPEEPQAPQGIGSELGSLFDPESAMEQQDEGGDIDTDILDYIMNKLEGFGYPPRRLQEFKDEFVSEKLLPGDARDVSLVFPDMYYGKGKRLKKDDVNNIIEEVQNQFGLAFKDGERKDKKVFLNFISQSQAGGSEEEEQGMGDELDVAFGGGVEKPKSKKKKAAQTQTEMMKSSMSDAFGKLNKRG